MLKKLMATVGSTLLAATLLVTPVGCGEEEPPVPPAPRDGDGQDSGQQDQDPMDEPALPSDDDVDSWGQDNDN